MKKIVYACDVGSTKQNNFAWASAELTSAKLLGGSDDIDELIHRVATDLNDGNQVALGFEAPMFVPVPAAKSGLSSARANEGNRSMFAPAGAYVTTLGLQQAAYILKGIYDRCDSPGRVTFQPDEWHAGDGATLLLWEAFVTGDAKNYGNADAGSGHIQDAGTAVKYFCTHFNDTEMMQKVTTDHPLSTLGAALLWSGWTTDLDFLKMGCLVAKPA